MEVVNAPRCTWHWMIFNECPTVEEPFGFVQSNGLAAKSCSYSSQSQLRRRATIGLVLIVLSIWNRQILYMLGTCFRATATVSSLLWGEWLRVWLWSLNSQLNLALLQEWARSEWSIWTLKTVCLMLRKHVGIRDFLSTVETGFRDHRNPGAAILWVEASFVYDGWMSGIEQLCAIDTPQGGSVKFRLSESQGVTPDDNVAMESQRVLHFNDFQCISALHGAAWPDQVTSEKEPALSEQQRRGVEPGSRVIRIARRHDTDDSNQSLNGERAQNCQLKFEGNLHNLVLQCDQLLCSKTRDIKFWFILILNRSPHFQHFGGRIFQYISVLTFVLILVMAFLEGFQWKTDPFVASHVYFEAFAITYTSPAVLLAEQIHGFEDVPAAQLIIIMIIMSPCHDLIADQRLWLSLAYDRIAPQTNELCVSLAYVTSNQND